MVESMPLGRMLSLSKSGYRQRFPDHLVVFNANIFTKSGTKIWHGDLDITLDGEALKDMAARSAEELYIFREADGRFSRENNPLWEAAIARVTVDTVTILTATR